MEGEKSLDQCLSLLMDWLKRCKGKEKELKKAIQDDGDEKKDYGEFQMEHEKA